MLDAENDIKVTNTKAHAMHHTEGTLMNTQTNKTNTTQTRGQQRQQSDKCYRCNGANDSEACYFKDCHYCNKQGHCLRAYRQRLRDLQSRCGQHRRANQAHFNVKDGNDNSTTKKERQSQNKDKQQWKIADSAADPNYTKLQDDATNIKTEYNSIKTLTGTKTATTVGQITILDR
eukprot:Pgem_evm1s8909